MKKPILSSLQRTLSLLVLLGAAPVFAAPVVAAAQSVDGVTVYLVRHAETVADGGDDPALSAEGHERAERLARMLASAGLTAVHTTDYARTRGTAGAVARAAGLEPRSYDPRNLQALAARLKEEGGVHLVVGHSNTTPAMVQLLGGEPGGPLSEEEYGRVYQVSVAGDAVRTAILGYPGGFLADPPASPEAVASPTDVESVDAIVASLYDVISGPAGEPRDWDRLRSLFLPTARMVPVQRAPDGRVAYRALAVEEYSRGRARCWSAWGSGSGRSPAASIGSATWPTCSAPTRASARATRSRSSAG